MVVDWNRCIDAEQACDWKHFGSMCCGIEVYRANRLLILRPGAGLRVLPSGHYNEGFVDSPTAIVNMTSMGRMVEMGIMGKPLSVNDQFTARSLERAGLDPGGTVAFGTAAHMDNASIVNGVSRGGIRVSVAATGGVRGNGGRAGDPAFFDEAEREYSWKSGTIVLIVAIESTMTDGAMLDAMLAATQAKSCVLQELQARSLYSHGVATGSGTDQVGIACLRGEEAAVDRAGVSTDVGDAVCECVREALYRALDLQSGMNPNTQCDPYVLLSRMGIQPSRVHDELRYPHTMAALLEADSRLHEDRRAATAVQAALGVMDEVGRGGISEESGLETVRGMFEGALIGSGDIDPVSRILLESCETIEEYVCLALSVLLNRMAGERGATA